MTHQPPLDLTGDMIASAGATQRAPLVPTVEIPHGQKCEVETKRAFRRGYELTLCRNEAVAWKGEQFVCHRHQRSPRKGPLAGKGHTPKTAPKDVDGTIRASLWNSSHVRRMDFYTKPGEILATCSQTWELSEDGTYCALAAAEVYGNCNAGSNSHQRAILTAVAQAANLAIAWNFECGHPIEDVLPVDD